MNGFLVIFTDQGFLTRTALQEPLADQAIKSRDFFSTCDILLCLFNFTGAVMTTSKDINIDKLKERFNAQGIPKIYKLE